MDRGQTAADAWRRFLRPLAAWAALGVIGCQTNPAARAQAPVAPIAPPAPVATVPLSETAPVVPAGLSVADRATPQVRTVCTIGSDVVITDEEVWQIVRFQIAAGGTEGLSAEQQKAKEKRLFDESLLQLIKQELILTDFLTKLKKNAPTALGSLTDESQREAQRRVKEIRRNQGNASEEKMIAVMQMQGINYKVFVRQLERDAMLNIYLQTYMKDKGKGISVAEVERYYKANPEQFKTEDKVKWLDLFLSYNNFPSTQAAQAQAAKIAAEAKGGADFAKLVAAHGQGDSKLRGGVGTGTKPEDIRPPELRPAVLALKAGEISAVLPTETGLHIVKVTEREYAGVHPFDAKAQMFVRSKLMEQLRQREMDKLVRELWQKTTVKVVDLPETGK